MITPTLSLEYAIVFKQYWANSPGGNRLEINTDLKEISQTGTSGCYSSLTMGEMVPRSPTFLLLFSYQIAKIRRQASAF